MRDEQHGPVAGGSEYIVNQLTAGELVDDVFAVAGDRTVLLITHRTEGLDLVDRVVTL